MKESVLGMKIGFLGFGEAAFNIACGLNQSRQHDILIYDAMQDHPIMGQLVQKRIEESGVVRKNSPEEVVDGVDLVFAAVPSSNTVQLCQTISGKLREGQFYVDVSASTPDVKKTVWEFVKPSGALFVDAAMMGSLPQKKHEVPIVASGNGAEQFREMMTPCGMQITCISEVPGAASAIKLVRSIYMKGIAALMIETLQGADAYDVADEVIHSISSSMDNIPFEDHLNRLVVGTAIHAARRGKELSGSEQLLEERGLNACMVRAARKKHELLADEHFAEKYVVQQPKSWKEIIKAIQQKGN